MTKGLTEPHVLLAAGNLNKLIRNLAGIISDVEIEKIQSAVNNEVAALFQLGLTHYDFAISLDKVQWRQRVSRLYYAAYNVKRAVQLCDNGVYSTDSSDHQKIDQLPDSLPNAATYRVKLKNMRDDRNLADYSHLGKEADLLIKPEDMQRAVADFIADSKSYLRARSVAL